MAALRRTVLRRRRRQARGDRVRVHEQRQRRPQAERGVGPVLRAARDEHAVRLAVDRVRFRHLLLRGVEDVRPAAELRGQVDDRHDDHEVDQGVLDERDHRRRPQAARVGVRREQRERDEQREVLGDDAVAAAEADDLEHRLDADQLERDVGHRRDEARHGHGEREAARAEPAAHEVGRGDVAVPVADRPHPAHEDEDDRVEHDRVGHGEEPGHRAGRPHRRRDRDERVGGVEVTAEQEPGDPGAERTAPEAPLVERLHARRAAPPGGPEAHHGDEREQHDEHGEGDAVDVVHARSPRAVRSPEAHSVPRPRSSIGRCGRATSTMR